MGIKKDREKPGEKIHLHYNTERKGISKMEIYDTGSYKWKHEQACDWENGTLLHEDGSFEYIDNAPESTMDIPPTTSTIETTATVVPQPQNEADVFDQFINGQAGA